jgi:sulfite exporter TauE/SafE
MTLAAIIAGFTLGATGSLHCIGMCGPLSLALPTYHLSKTGKFISLLLYQAGRIITYSLAGLLFGLAGHRIYLAGYQQWFSIGLGTIILAAAFLYFIKQRTVHIPFLTKFYAAVQQSIGRLLKKVSNPSSFLLIGMANGLLPCGMVYIALAAVLSFPALTDSILFMAMFGTGTLPAMMMVTYAGQFVKPGIRSGMRKAIPVFITLMGLVLVLRGLNLGIPFLSPAIPVAPGDPLICHP